MLPTLLASVVSGEAQIAIRRLRLAVTVYILAGLLCAIGLGFLIAAGYVVAEARYGPLWASLYFGLGFVGLAIVLVIIFRIVAAMRVRSERRRRSTEAKALISAAAIAVLPALLAARKGTLMAAPLIAGAAFIALREWLPRKPPRS